MYNINLKEWNQTDPKVLQQKAEEFLKNNQSETPKDIFEGLAICYSGLNSGENLEIFSKLYDNLIKNWKLFNAAIHLDNKDYQQWFKDSEKLHLLAIEKKVDKSHATLGFLYQFPRIPYIDKEKTLEQIEKGIKVKESNCYAIKAWLLSEKSYDENNQEIEKLLSQAEELGYKYTDIYRLTIEYQNAKDEKELSEIVEKYLPAVEKNQDGYCFIANYYLRIGDSEKALSYLQKGVEKNEGNSLYILGLEILRGNFPNFTQKQGYEMLDKALYLSCFDAGYALGCEYIYSSSEENLDIPKGLKYLTKSAEYNNIRAIMELALFYLYNKEYFDLNKGLEYLEMALKNNYTRAKVEKAYLLLENEEAYAKNPKEAKRLLKEATEEGDTYAPFRLGLGYQNGEFDEKNDLEKALHYFEISAERDNQGGLENAGRYYHYGYVGEPQFSKAIQYFQRAIELYNSAFAKVELAIMHEYGEGLTPNFQEALELLQEALEDNYTYAALRIGYIYNNEDFEGKNSQKAFENFLLAAQEGIPDAIYNVARCYQDGVGISENEEEAIKWYQKATEAGVSSALVDLGLIYERGYGSISEDENKAFELMQKAAEGGVGYAQYKLGTYYLYGFGTEENLEKAKEWFQYSYENEIPFAALSLGDFYLYDYLQLDEAEKAFEYYKFAADRGIYNEGLGHCYIYGLGVEYNEEEAFKAYKKAADDGVQRAYYSLALCYYNGRGTKEDKVEAFDYFNKSIETGNANAIAYIGKMLVEGNGAPQNIEEGVAYLKESAEKDSDLGQYELGNCYLQGIGVTQDDQIALEWYQKAAENGNKDAEKIVGKPRRRQKS